MNDIIPFNFDDHAVRVATDEHGEPRFVAKDVADALGYTRTSDALEHTKHSAVLPQLNKDNNLAPATKWIPESDVYRMVMRSTLPAAERFQDWIVEEVLPAIRKTGSYALNPRDHALQLAPLATRAAQAFGFTGNQAVLSANRAIKHFTGVDLLEAMGHPALPAPEQEPLLTPSDLALRLGMPKREANPRLTLAGLQDEHRDHKDRLYYELTGLGRAYGVYLDTGKKHSNGAPIRQIKWRAAVIDFLSSTRACA